MPDFATLFSSPLAFAVMFAGIAIGGFARGYSGFGMSALVVASWSLVADPAIAVAVVIQLEIVASIVQAAWVWRDVPWKRVGLLLIGAAVGTPLGVALLVYTPRDPLRLGIAIFVLIASLLMLKGLSFKRRTGPVGTAAVGAASGVANGAVAMGGLPLALFLAADGDTPKHMRAAAIGYFFLLDLMSLLLLLRQDIVTSKVLWLAALALPLMLAGLWLGGRHFAGATPESFRRSILRLLMVIATIGILQGLWRLMHG
jgi:uncharacterized membrane protein YfcA